MTQYLQTPSQTIGPFFGPFLLYAGCENLVDEQTQGKRITIVGRVIDGEGNPVPDAMVEIWQANAAGRYAHPADMREEPTLDPHFIGFGRCGTSDDGTFRFETIKPGRVPAPNGASQAPHLEVGVFARGLLKRLATRCYFADESANGEDPILALVPSERRATLIAPAIEDAVQTHYRFDIVLRGPNETVFFEC
jgi:protocatechuate 3,4-dioxygenase alpha subunit